MTIPNLTHNHNLWPTPTLRRGRRAGCVAAIVSFVFLFVLAPASAATEENTEWTKYDNTIPGDTNTTSTAGRIPLGTSGKGDDKGTLCQAVIKDGSVYKMWYSGNAVSGNKMRIYYAFSTDGLIWTKYNNAVPGTSNTNGTDGRIPLGTSGGDSSATYQPAVIKNGSTYKMWYSGSDGVNYRIYHATSPDGLSWTKYSNSVPDASNTTGTHGRIPLGETGGDNTHVSNPHVIKVRLTYKMWYAGHDGSNWRLYYATSTDGLTWTKCTNAVPDDSDTTSTYGRCPRGDTAGRGDNNGVASASVIKEGLIQEGYTYKMWYSGSSGTGCWRIYHATCEQPPPACLIFIGH